MISSKFMEIVFLPMSRLRGLGRLPWSTVSSTQQRKKRPDTESWTKTDGSLLAPWRLKMETFNSITVENYIWKIEKLGLKRYPHGSKALLKMILFFARVGCGSSLEGHDSRLKDKPQWAVGAKQFPQQQQCLKYQKDTLKAHGTRTPINMAMRSWDPLLFWGVWKCENQNALYFLEFCWCIVVFKMLCTWPHAGSTQAHSCAGAWLKKVWSR